MKTEYLPKNLALRSFIAPAERVLLAVLDPTAVGKPANVTGSHYDDTPTGCHDLDGVQVWAWKARLLR